MVKTLAIAESLQKYQYHHIDSYSEKRYILGYISFWERDPLKRWGHETRQSGKQNEVSSGGPAWIFFRTKTGTGKR